MLLFWLEVRFNLKTQLNDGLDNIDKNIGKKPTTEICKELESFLSKAEGDLEKLKTGQQELRMITLDL